MTISKDLFLAILSMDSYNRGYGSGITLSDAMGTQGEAVSHACRTEESGMSVTVWNHAVMCCDVLQHGITARWAGKSIQVFELS